MEKRWWIASTLGFLEEEEEGKMLVSTYEFPFWFTPLLSCENIPECQATRNMFKVVYVASKFTNVFALLRKECRASPSLSKWPPLCLKIPFALCNVDWHSSCFACGSCNESQLLGGKQIQKWNIPWWLNSICQTAFNTFVVSLNLIEPAHLWDVDILEEFQRNIFNYRG